MLRYFSIFFLLILTSNSNSEIKDKIIKNLKNINNLDFKFEQNVNGKIENGICTIEYKLSIPESADDNIGTPITGNKVFDATIPGK